MNDKAYSERELAKVLTLEQMRHEIHNWHNQNLSEQSNSYN